MSADAIDHDLRALENCDRAERQKAYLKSDLLHYGVPVPALHTIADQAAPSLDRATLLRLVTALWDEPVGSPVWERRFVAADLLSHRADLLYPVDLPFAERLCREARTWAILDTLAPRVVGALADRFPDEVSPVLDRWAEDDDFWLRRAALLAHLIPLRDGRGDWARFTRYADGLLDDREFFVAKAIGWVLRDTSRRRPDLVMAWVEPRAHRLHPVSFREAIKKLPADDQARLKKRRAMPPQAD